MVKKIIENSNASTTDNNTRNLELNVAVYETIIHNINIQLEKRNISVAFLAKQANLSERVLSKSINNKQKDRRILRIDEFQAISRVLGTSMDRLCLENDYDYEDINEMLTYLNTTDRKFIYDLIIRFKS